MSSGMAAVRQIPLLDLKAQHARIRGEMLEAATALIDSQKFILGSDVEAFEAEIAAYSGARFAVGCASGSDALFLALLAAGVQPGDRVVTTPYTFFATAGAISRAGAVPVFVDVEAATFNIDPVPLADAVRVGDRVRAIIPVHLFGGCADMDPILEIARERGITVIEDAAQAIGSEYKGQRAGSLGHMGCFSFFPSKNLGGYGDGGMLTTNDEGTADLLKALRIHGRKGKYIHHWIGINSRLDALQAAVLRVKFRYLDGWTARRQENAALYRRLIADLALPVSAPPPPAYQTRHVYNQFAVRAADRDQLQVFLKQRGIGSEVYYPLPLHLQQCFADLGYKRGDFPVSEQLALDSLSLPVNPEVSAEDIAYICDSIRAFYN
jgi:dTDP-4-amino-4,6-dideoxygalactose transaminase